MSKSNTSSVIAVMSVFFVVMGVGILTPAIQNIAEAFPDVPFTTIILISTLPSLFIVPASIIAGVLAGSKVKYRTLLHIGLFIFAVAGTIPYVLNDFTMILVSRAIFGIGLGIVFPLGGALILKLFEGQQRANMLGASNVVMNIGGIALQMGGALLCAISWRYTFFAHLIALVALLLVAFFLPEPERVEAEANAPKVKMPFAVYTIALLTAANTILLYPMLLNMSTIIINDKLGNAANAGVVLSMFTVGGMVGGAVFGYINKIIGKFGMGIGLMVGGVGLLVIYFAPSLTLLTIGTLIVGIGSFTFAPAAMMYLGTIVPPAAFGNASGVVAAVLNLGGFVSPFYMSLLVKVTGITDIRFPLFFGFISLIILGIVMLIFAKLKIEDAPVEPAPEPAPAA
jgi:MFS family permease